MNRTTCLYRTFSCKGFLLAPLLCRCWMSAGKMWGILKQNPFRSSHAGLSRGPPEEPCKIHIHILHIISIKSHTSKHAWALVSSMLKFATADSDFRQFRIIWLSWNWPKYLLQCVFFEVSLWAKHSFNCIFQAFDSSTNLEQVQVFTKNVDAEVHHGGTRNIALLRFHFKIKYVSTFISYRHVCIQLFFFTKVKDTTSRRDVSLPGKRSDFLRLWPRLASPSSSESSQSIEKTFWRPCSICSAGICCQQASSIAACMAESSESLGGWSNGSKRKTQLLQKGTFDSIEKHYWQNSTLQTTLLLGAYYKWARSFLS